MKSINLRVGMSVFKKILFAICLILSIFLCTGLSIYYYQGDTDFDKADAAIVLGAAAWGNEPSPVFRERINHAIWLYKNNQVSKIIFTGGKRADDQPAESEVAKVYAMNNGVNESDILVETKSTITAENLFYAKEAAMENKLNSFLIVSDPLHMKRAMLIVKDLGLNAYSSPTPSTLYRSFGSKFGFVLRECIFYLWYLIVRCF